VRRHSSFIVKSSAKLVIKIVHIDQTWKQFFFMTWAKKNSFSSFYFIFAKLLVILRKQFFLSNSIHSGATKCMRKH